MTSNICMSKTSRLLQKSRGRLLSNVYVKIARSVPSGKMVQREGIFAAGPPRRTHSGLEWAHLSLPCSHLSLGLVHPPILWAIQTLHGPSSPVRVAIGFHGKEDGCRTQNGPWLTQEALWQSQENRRSGRHAGCPFD